MRTALALLALGLLATPAGAQEELGTYFAEIGPEDLRNSDGVRLGDLGSILQQDRANYHRFGVRHGGDGGDPFFASREARAAIPDLYRRGPRDGLIERIVEGGEPLGLRVFVCGRNGIATFIAVDFADGDGYRGCR